MGIARNMAAGEIAYKSGDAATAFKLLREAVEMEDKLVYDEPPGWMQPVRHALGALLLAEGRAAEAEQVYREDLKRLPNNGWSLYGLAQALKAQGKPAEAAEYEAQFQKIWAKADTKINSSCLCQEGITLAP